LGQSNWACAKRKEREGVKDSQKLHNWEEKKRGAVEQGSKPIKNKASSIPEKGKKKADA